MLKNTDLKLSLNPAFDVTIKTNNVVWSHDRNSYKFEFKFTEKDRETPLNLTYSVPRVAIEFTSVQDSDVQIYLMDIDDAKEGLASFTVPDRMLGYVGNVRANITVDCEERTHDLGNFSFKMKKSAIDNKMPELDFYVEEFEEALEKLEQLDLDNKIDQLNKLEEAINGLGGVDEALASKTDKTDFEAEKTKNQNEHQILANDIESLKLTKADKSELEALSDRLTDVESKEVDLTPINETLELKADKAEIGISQNLVDLSNVCSELGILGSGPVFTTSTARSILLEVEENQVYSLSRAKIECPRFRVGFTDTFPENGQIVLEHNDTYYKDLYSNVENDSKLKIENIKTPKNAKYMIVYLSNNSQDKLTNVYQVEKGAVSTDFSLKAKNLVQLTEENLDQSQRITALEAQIQQLINK